MNGSKHFTQMPLSLPWGLNHRNGDLTNLAVKSQHAFICPFLHLTLRTSKPWEILVKILNEIVIVAQPT